MRLDGRESAPGFGAFGTPSSALENPGDRAPLSRLVVPETASGLQGEQPLVRGVK